MLCGSSEYLYLMFDLILITYVVACASLSIWICILAFIFYTGKYVCACRVKCMFFSGKKKVGCKIMKSDYKNCRYRIILPCILFSTLTTNLRHHPPETQRPGGQTLLRVPSGEVWLPWAHQRNHEKTGGWSTRRDRQARGQPALGESVGWAPELGEPLKAGGCVLEAYLFILLENNSFFCRVSFVLR